ncbi:hypothetical protein [Methanospirillum sp.]
MYLKYPVFALICENTGFHTYLLGGNIYLTTMGFILGLGLENQFLTGSLLIPIDEPMDDMMITMIYSFRWHIKNIYVYFNGGKHIEKMVWNYGDPGKNGVHFGSD